MKALFVCDDCYPAQAVPLCAKYQCGLEIQSFYDPSHIVEQPDTIANHQRLIAGISPRSFHGPFGDLCPGSFDVMVRDLTMYRFEQAARVAEQLGARQMILHHGYRTGTGPAKFWMKRSVVFWRQFLAARPADFKLRLENVFDPDPTMAAELIDSIDDSRADVNLDVGHVHCFSHGNPVEWVKALNRRIGYVHLHDNHGAEDEHLGLGMGNIPLDDVLAALQQYAPDAIWALECKIEYMAGSLEWISRYR